MTLDEYQTRAKLTAVYPPEIGLTYVTLKLNGEAGEVAELVGKMYRDDGGVLSEGRREKLIKELGDVLWYVANLALELHVPLSEVAECNLAKLASREARGVLKGEGSDR